MLKDVKGFENYLIDEDGNVWSKLRKVQYKNGYLVTKGGKKVTPHQTKNGYLFVTLYKDKVKYQKKVHRLVAETFIPNPENLPFVNHRDEDKTNNSICNLEWCTTEYNNCYGNRLENLSRKMLNRLDQSIKVEMFDLEGNLIDIFPSLAEASRFVNGSATNIQKCCVGRYKTAYKYIWKYHKE